MYRPLCASTLACASTCLKLIESFMGAPVGVVAGRGSGDADGDSAPHGKQSIATRALLGNPPLTGVVGRFPRRTAFLVNLERKDVCWTLKMRGLQSTRLSPGSQPTTSSWARNI